MKKSEDINSDSESSAIEEEDEELETKMEESFLDHCGGIGSDKDQNDKTIKFAEEPREMEMMFILFSFYKEEVSNIGFEFDCRAKISLNKVKIISASSQDDVDKCRAKMVKFLEKVLITELEHDNKFRIFCSPFMKAKALENHFGLCKFNCKIYCHSIKLEKKELLSRMRDIFNGQRIFPVQYKPIKEKERDIYTHIRSFLRKMKEYHKEESEERKVVVEFDSTECRINCIGLKERDLLAIKNIFRNLLQSTVVIILKFATEVGIESKVQELKTLAKKKSKFPIQVSKIEKKAVAIISKENVARKFLELSKTIELMALKEKTEMGMFLLKINNFNERKAMIEELCEEKGYGFSTLGSNYYYFKKMFIHEDEEADYEETFSIVKAVLEAIKERKENFAVPERIHKLVQAEQEIEVMVGEFYSSGKIVMDEEIRKVLRRDVLKECLKMSKPGLVRYKVFQGTETSNEYWYLHDNQKIKCEISDMKPGVDYFNGKLKTQGNEKEYFYEAKINVI